MSSPQGLAPGPPPSAAAADSGSAVRMHVRETTRELLDGFRRHDLLTYASAISFQILTAVVPFLLFILAVAGTFHIVGVWRDHIAPQIRMNVSPAMYSVLASAVNNVLSSRRLLWLTLGGALALWQVSGAVRAVMGALARIYGAPGERSFKSRYTISFVLSIEVGACFVVAALCFLLAPFHPISHPSLFWQVLAFVLRWMLVLGSLLLAVGLLVRHAPSTAQTLPWVTFGAALVIVTWVAVSLLFDLYLTKIASYQSVFGNLAAVIVAMAYLYTSTIVFLFGAQLDAIIRARTTGELSGMPQDGAGA